MRLLRIAVGLAFIAGVLPFAGQASAAQAAVRLSDVFDDAGRRGLSVAGEQASLVEFVDARLDLGLADRLPDPAAGPDLLTLPAPVERIVRDVTLRLSEGAAEGTAAGEPATSTPPAVTVTEVDDVTGDGTADVVVRQHADEHRPAQLRLVDGRDGATLWTRDGHGSVSTITDIDGDGRPDLGVAETVTDRVEEIEDEGDTVQRYGARVHFTQRNVVRSSATGDQLWATEAVAGSFEFALRFHNRRERVSDEPDVAVRNGSGLGIEVGGEGLLATPTAIPGPQPRLVVDTYSFHAFGDARWEGPVVDGVGGVAHTDIQAIGFDYEGRIEVRDAVSDDVVESWDIPLGDTSAGLSVVPDLNGDGQPDLALTRYRTPDEEVRCHRGVACSDPLEAKAELRIDTLDGLDHRPLSSIVRDELLDVELHLGADHDGDGGPDALIQTMGLDDGTATRSTALADLATGTWRWEAPGPTVSQLFALAATDHAHGSRLLRGSADLGSDPATVTLHRLDLTSGTPLPSSTLELAKPDAPGTGSDEPYVQFLYTLAAFDVGGDVDGDGVVDPLLSLMMDERWSDDRPDTARSTWAVMSGSADGMVFTDATDRFSYVFGSADHTGDDRAEFMRADDGVVTERDGATGDLRWARPPGLRDAGDLSGDGVADYLRVTEHGPAVRISGIDGPSRLPLWSLDIS